MDDGYHCSVCEKKRTVPGVNTLEMTHPHIAKWWSQNNQDAVDTYMSTSYHRATWICETCGGEFKQLINEVVEEGFKCSYCSGKKVLAGFNSLDVTHPELVKAWSPNNARDITEFMETNAYNALWHCSTCGGEFNQRIKDAVNTGLDCPYCSDRKVLPGFNSFADRHPDLMEGWITRNNYAICDPTQVLDKSSKKVWWQCSNNPKHIYPQRIKDHVMFDFRGIEPCLYCKGRRRKILHF